MTKEKAKIDLPDLSSATPLKKLVWRIRRALRDVSGKDFLEDSHAQQPLSYRIYKKADQFIERYFPYLTSNISKKATLARVKDMIKAEGYEVVEADEKKPWGAYYRISNDQAERFVASLFPEITIEEARLGRSDIQISPKFLVVSPGMRLSWQYHLRRAEKWRFLTTGSYIRSKTDKETELIEVPQDTVVQFETTERHRLCAPENTYTLVAEIWQHTDPENPSDEADIIRLQDDHGR